MKYEAVTKLERNMEIVYLHRFQPDLSLREIGKNYHITAQRVSAILKRARQKETKKII